MDIDPEEEEDEKLPAEEPLPMITPQILQRRAGFEDFHKWYENKEKKVQQENTTENDQMNNNIQRNTHQAHTITKQCTEIRKTQNITQHIIHTYTNEHTRQTNYQQTQHATNRKPQAHNNSKHDTHTQHTQHNR